MASNTVSKELKGAVLAHAFNPQTQEAKAEFKTSLKLATTTQKNPVSKLKEKKDLCFGQAHALPVTLLHGEMAQLLRALVVLPNDPYSVPRTHMMANNSCVSFSGYLTHADNTHT